MTRDLLSSLVAGSQARDARLANQANIDLQRAKLRNEVLAEQKAQAQNELSNLAEMGVIAAKQAIENDVHILGISSLAAGHKTLVPQVISELKKYEREDIMVIVGGVIPVQDYQFLFDCGAVGVFGPGTKIAQAAIDMITILIDSVE